MIGSLTVGNNDVLTYGLPNFGSQLAGVAGLFLVLVKLAVGLQSLQPDRAQPNPAQH